MEQHQPQHPELVGIDASRRNHQPAAPAQRRDHARLAWAGPLEPVALQCGRTSQQYKEQGVHPAHRGNARRQLQRWRFPECVDVIGDAFQSLFAIRHGVEKNRRCGWPYESDCCGPCCLRGSCSHPLWVAVNREIGFAEKSQQSDVAVVSHAARQSRRGRYGSQQGGAA